MKSEKGFTLLEVILAVGIFAIVAVPIVSMFLDGIKITSRSENTSEAYAYAQEYIEKLKGGEIPVVNGTTGSIEGTEYTYLITAVNSKTAEELNAEREADGDNLYKYLNDTESVKVVVNDSSININGISLSSFENIKINSDYDWNVDGTIVNVGKNNIWMQYGDLSSKKVLSIHNDSGQRLNIYLQWIGENESVKNNLKIKNIAGATNVYGPVVGLIEGESRNRGRKQTAEVTVTVKNSRTGEHAELTANVTYYE